MACVFFYKFNVFFLTCAQKKNALHVCGGMKTLKHYVRTTCDSLATTIKISHTRAKHVT